MDIRRRFRFDAHRAAAGLMPCGDGRLLVLDLLLDAVCRQHDTLEIWDEHMIERRGNIGMIAHDPYGITAHWPDEPCPICTLEKVIKDNYAKTEKAEHVPRTEKPL